jgi:hypothetical protein
MWGRGTFDLTIRVLFVTTSALSVAGCGVVAGVNRMNADNAMAASEASYKQCLVEHPNNAAAACESARLIYETDLRAYTARAGLNVNTNNTNTTTSR